MWPEQCLFSQVITFKVTGLGLHVNVKPRSDHDIAQLDSLRNIQYPQQVLNFSTLLLEIWSGHRAKDKGLTCMDLAMLMQIMNINAKFEFLPVYSYSL